jgi:3-oxoadipyl-CoA thiolase
MPAAYICDGIRTPIGRFNGALAKVRADDLAALTLKALVARHDELDPKAIDEVILGCANQAERTIAMSPEWRPCWPDCRTACRV